MVTRGWYKQKEAKNTSEVIYKDVVFPFLTRLGISSVLLKGLSPTQCKTKRVRDGEKYKYEDHTYTVNPAGIFTATFDRVIVEILNNTSNYNPLLGTYFASKKGVYSACMAPAAELIRMFSVKEWQQSRKKYNILANTYETGVLFKTLPFSEVLHVLYEQQHIPFLYWSSNRNTLVISDTMKNGSVTPYN